MPTTFWATIRWRAPILFALAGAVIAGNIVTAVFFNAINMLYRGEPLSAAMFDLTVQSFAPAAGTAVILGCLAVEWWRLGWERSSAKRILEAKSVTCRTDIFYAVLTVSNIGFLLSFFFTLGVAHYYELNLTGHGLGLLKDAHPIFVFVLLFAMNSLCFYVYHRLLHTRFLWELHKTHHAATEMTIINNFRNHPLDRALRTVFFAIPLALLGVDPLVGLAYAALAGIIVLFQHSDMPWSMPWIERYIFIGSRGHRLHHCQDSAFAGKNLGYLVLWDWLFGTLSRADPSSSSLGIDDDPYGVQNTGSLRRELISVPVAAAKSFVREMRA